ncbi:MAG: DUF2130 domain-containing protein [Alphaproteobacteria bacterium]|nr:MAG: DUF2130 domain-containing protein [Alphaproteobacteria bacterium]
MINLIKCPHCGKDIEVTEVLTHSIRESMKIELENELAKKEKKLTEQQTALKNKEKDLVAQEESINEKVTEQLKTERKKIAEVERMKILAEESEKTKILEQDLAEQKKKVSEAKRKELELLKKQQELEEAKENVDLEVQRKITEKRKEIFEQASQKAAEEQQFKMREKDNQIEAMKKQLDEARRKAEVGSQEAQGEAMEGALKEILNQTFPLDIIADIKKGQKGADLIHIVRNNIAKECGKILWESKNTQTFNKDWIEKLKKDQQEEQAELAVIVSIALPKEIKNGFGVIDDIWITDYKTAICLATALRYGLINIAREKLIVTNQSTVKDFVYQYITGQEFMLQVKSIVDAFKRMQEDLDSEKRSHLKNWKSREIQISNVLGGISNICGAIEGHVGQKQLPQIDPLLLDTPHASEES